MNLTSQPTMHVSMELILCQKYSLSFHPATSFQFNHISSVYVCHQFSVKILPQFSVVQLSVLSLHLILVYHISQHLVKNYSLISVQFFTQHLPSIGLSIDCQLSVSACHQFSVPPNPPLIYCPAAPHFFTRHRFSVQLPAFNFFTISIILQFSMIMQLSAFSSCSFDQLSVPPQLTIRYKIQST